MQCLEEGGGEEGDYILRIHGPTDRSIIESEIGCFHYKCARLFTMIIV